MNFTTVPGLFSFLALLNSFPAAALSGQDSLAVNPKAINLNEFVVKGHGLESFRKKSRVSDVSLGFCFYDNPNYHDWDSTYFLTQFPSPSEHDFLLVTTEGRLADYDTSKFDLFLTVLQINGEDTMFRQIPIVLNSGERPKNAWSMNIREQGVILKPAPFYLGYGLDVKPMTESYGYRLYSTWGGKGTLAKIRNGKLDLQSNPNFPYIFPFKITYMEL